MIIISTFIHLYNMAPYIGSTTGGRSRTLQKMIGRPRIREALSKGDLLGLAYVPLLLWGNGWNLGQGYLVDDTTGEVRCQSCRARLQTPGI